jgi:hypothetical protein
MHDYATASLKYKQLISLQAKPLLAKHHRYNCWGKAVEDEMDDEGTAMELELAPESVIAGANQYEEEEHFRTAPLSELLPSDELQTYQKCFEQIGVDYRTEQLDSMQFQHLMEDLSHRSRGAQSDEPHMAPALDHEELHRVFTDIEQSGDGDGKISFDEFCRSVAKASSDSSLTEVARLAFDALDNDNDKHISSAELLGFMTAMYNPADAGNVPALSRRVLEVAPQATANGTDVFSLDIKRLRWHAEEIGMSPESIQAALEEPPLTHEGAEAMILEAEQFFATHTHSGGGAFDGQVRKTQSWPRSWANFSLL